jgi:hypothetical protein
MTDNNFHGIPASIYPQIVSLIGSFQIIQNYRGQGARTSVWKVANDEKNFIVKLHHKKEKWHPEVFAYSHWTGAYAPYAPPLVGILENDDTQGIVTTEIQGIPLREMDLMDKVIAEVYFQAGKLAGNLHRCRPGEWFGRPDLNGLPFKDRIDDPVIAMKNGFMRWYTKALDLKCLDKPEVTLAEWALENLNIFADEIPLPINEDYTPGNWLVDQQGKLVGIIDFECMEWGHRMDSFAMLWERYFPQNALFEEAFWAGYGTDLKKIYPLKVLIVCLKIGIADIAIGSEYNNNRNISMGRNLIRNIAKDYSTSIP